MPCHCWEVGGWCVELVMLSRDLGYWHFVAPMHSGGTWGCSRLAHHRVTWAASQCLMFSGVQSRIRILGICWNFRNKDVKLALSGQISLFLSWAWTLPKALCPQSESAWDEGEVMSEVTSKAVPSAPTKALPSLTCIHIKVWPSLPFPEAVSQLLWRRKFSQKHPT